MSSGAIDPAVLRLLVLENAVEIAPEDARAKAHTVSDGDLIVLAEAGDCDAVTHLFDRYSSQIFSIGFRILKDRGEAEDLVQEVFLALFDRIKGFDPEKGCGRTWIIQIAYRRAFDRRAYLTRRNFYNGTDIERVANVLASGFRLERQIADCMVTKQLQSSFSELNEKQRNTLQMYFFEGLTLREISERLGESLENVRHFYYRGMERLRKCAAAASKNRK